MSLTKTKHRRMFDFINILHKTVLIVVSNLHRIKIKICRWVVKLLEFLKKKHDATFYQAIKKNINCAQ